MCYSEFICYVCCHQLFCRANISFQFYFIICILPSALPMFTTQMAVVNDITEIKCTTLKNCYHVFSHTKKLWPNSPLPQYVLANCATDFLLKTGDTSCKLQIPCGLQFPWCKLALRMLKKQSNSLEEAMVLYPRLAQQVHPTVKCMLIMFLWHEWKCASQIPSTGRNHEQTFLCRCSTPTAKCIAKMTWELTHWKWVAHCWGF